MVDNGSKRYNVVVFVSVCSKCIGPNTIEMYKFWLWYSLTYSYSHGYHACIIWSRNLGVILLAVNQSRSFHICSFHPIYIIDVAIKCCPRRRPTTTVAATTANCHCQSRWTAYQFQWHSFIRARMIGLCHFRTIGFDGEEERGVLG